MWAAHPGGEVPDWDSGPHPRVAVAAAAGMELCSVVVVAEVEAAIVGFATIDSDNGAVGH